MPTYQYQFDDVESYLHHRPPYLLVERIRSINDHKIETEMTVREDAFFASGHFPDAPIMPGAMMQELTTQSAGILIAARHNPNREFDTSDPQFNEFALGVLVKVTGARYRSFARPGDTIGVEVTLNDRLASNFDFTAICRVKEKKIMRIGFQLTNIRSSILQGIESNV